MSRRYRISENRKLNPTYFVFCEGKTEEQYINYLKIKYRLPIIIDSKIAGNRITNKYINNYKKGKFTHQKDKTFLLYDLDAPVMLEKLRSINGTILISSNPCFELWFLLHYQEQFVEITCQDCIKKLKSKNNQYSKGIFNTDLKVVLEIKQLKAMHRAKKLKANENPSSLVYKLIDEMEKVKRKAEPSP